MKQYIKLKSYSDTRWLSLGESLQSITQQWCCLQEFSQNQMFNEKDFKLTQSQIKFLKIMVKCLTNTVKYVVCIYLHICK